MKSLNTLTLALLAVLCGCGDDDADNRCIFEGRYEFGYLSEMPACLPRSEALPFARHEEPCSQSFDDISLDLIRYNGLISCPTGDPVVECEGFANFANGCSYDVYVRRVGP